MMNKRILVVEDDAIIVEDLQRTLTHLGYCVPYTAQSGDEALCAALELKPDLVLMDIKLKGKLDGVETAARLRRRLDVPIVYLTSHSDEMTLARAKETAPQGYLLKPFHERDLRVVVEVAIRKHELETRLAQRERWFSTTLESIGDAVVATDPAGCVTFMNVVAETVTGWNRDLARGRNVAEVCPLIDEQDLAISGLLARAVSERSANPIPANTRLVSRSGSCVEIDGSSAPIIEERGEVLGGVMVFRDLTARKKLEQKLRHAERMASIGTLAAGTAHEINNPLAAVIGNVEIAMDRVRSLHEELRATRQASGLALELDELLELLADAARAGERVRNIVQDLGKFARTDNVESAPLELRAVIEAALNLTEHQIRLKARLIRQYGATPLVDANEGRLVQVLTNLLVNAAQAIEEGNAAANIIRIATYTDEGGRAVLEVQDSGQGIAQEHLPHVFEPFFTTKEVGRGMGLGLSICHGIVTDLGGEISVTSQPGQGSVFRVSLPAATRAALAKEPAKPPPALVRKGRVLVIDDDPAVCRIIERALQAGHEVVTETDARAALARLQHKESFDLILCDLMMPTMSGVDFYHQVQSLQPDVTKRMVFLTGGAFSARAEAFLKEVERPVLTKPFTPSSLRAIVTEYLG